jgi:hypothetical protein
MAADELTAKFTECASQVLDENSTRRALETIKSLEMLEDIRPLCQVLMGSHPG